MYSRKTKRYLFSRRDASNSLLARGKWAMCIYRPKPKPILQKRAARSYCSLPPRRSVRSTNHKQRRLGFFTSPVENNKTFFHLHRIKIARAELRSRPHQGGFHLAFSASEVFAGVAVSDWPLPYAVLIYRFPSFVIFVVQPVFQVITAELPSSSHVPVIPSPRVAFAAPPLDSAISNGYPAVSFTFHTPSNALSARAPKLVTPKKQAAIAAFLIFVLLATSMLVTENKPNGSASHITLFPAKAVQLAETDGKRSDIDSRDLIQSALDPRRHPASSRETIGVRLLLRILFCTAGYPGSYPSVRLSNSSRSAFDSRAISASRCLTTSPMERFPQACHPRSQEDVGTFPSSSVP